MENLGFWCQGLYWDRIGWSLETELPHHDSCSARIPSCFEEDVLRKFARGLIPIIDDHTHTHTHTPVLLLLLLLLLFVYSCTADAQNEDERHAAEET